MKLNGVEYDENKHEPSLGLLRKNNDDYGNVTYSGTAAVNADKPKRGISFKAAVGIYVFFVILNLIVFFAFIGGSLTAETVTVKLFFTAIGLSMGITGLWKMKGYPEKLKAVKEKCTARVSAKICDYKKRSAAEMIHRHIIRFISMYGKTRNI